MIRRPLHRSDANQKHIIRALRELGVKVELIGEPVDLLTGYRGVLRLLEVKDGTLSPSERKLRPSQKKFIEEWQGYPIFKVETIEQALKVHGISLD